jgi:Ser/Thr protein kinase RdoA (MazF antagonist)
MDNILEILNHWGIKRGEILQQLNTYADRPVYKIQTEMGVVLLKGHSADVSEEFIVGNIHAHEFLGNLQHMAPKLYYKTDGSGFYRDDNHFYYLMEYIDGRQGQETVDDEILLGEATAKLHTLSGYTHLSTYHVPAIIKRAKGWFFDYDWKCEFDELLDSLPDFDNYKQCFIHTDVHPQNVIIRDNKVIFIDLDDSGLGSPYIDFGYAFIMQFVNHNKKTQEMKYEFELAKAYLEGYMRLVKLTRFEYDLLWSGAIISHINLMKCYGPDAEIPLWNILKFGLAQKDKLFEMVEGIS